MHADDTKDEASLASGKDETPEMSPHHEDEAHADNRNPDLTTQKNTEENNLKDLSQEPQDMIALMPPKSDIESTQPTPSDISGALVDILGGAQYDMNSVKTIHQFVKTSAIIQVQETLTKQDDLNCSVLMKASDASQALNQTTSLENNKDTNETELEQASRAPAKHNPLSDNPTACEADPIKHVHGSKPGTAPMQDAVSESGIDSETANELSDPTSMNAKDTTGPEFAKNKDDKSMKPPASVRTGLIGDQKNDHELKVATSPSRQDKGTKKGPCNTGSAS